MDNSPDISEKHRKLVQEVLFKVGRNLLLFQSVETFLKITLPMMVSRKTGDAAMPWKDVSALLASKNMLGELVQKLKETIDSEGEKAFEAYVDAVLKHRNDLVHHFLSRSDGNLETIERCRSALAYLDEQHLFSTPLLAMVQQLTSATMILLETSITDNEGQAPRTSLLQ